MSNREAASSKSLTVLKPKCLARLLRLMPSLRSSELGFHCCKPLGDKWFFSLLTIDSEPNWTRVERVLLNCCFKVFNSCLTSCSWEAVTKTLVSVVSIDSDSNSSIVAFKLSIESKVK